MELFEDTQPAPGNAPALTVSELSGAVRRVVEGEFGRVRVRGEVGRVSRPSSGHLYFDLKDDRAVLAAVCWRDNACKLPHRPEEGLEVIVTGRLTTFPGQSKYQLLVESVEPAGLGALMAMLDQRRRAFAAEGLFDAARKRPIPYLPGVIAVVTSPSGAVIRDILHRLRDRFPSRVLIWPVAVQGAQSAPQVAAAIRALNALAPGGPVARPDLIIVARGGGSVEDLWGFNDEGVVRAVADGTIPLISAVGHETDTTLIDHAADLRAPTPTAAAEMAVPVLAELGARLADSQTRLWRSARARIDNPAQRLGDLGRALGRPQAMTEGARQRLDLTAQRIEPALRGFVRDRRRRAEAQSLPLYALRSFMVDRRGALSRTGQGLDAAIRRAAATRLAALPVVRPAAVRLVQGTAQRRFSGQAQRIDPALMRRLDGARQRLAGIQGRLSAAHARTRRGAQNDLAADRTALAAAARRLEQALPRALEGRREAVETLDRLRQTLGHTQTLRRGFAIVRGEGRLVTSATEAAGARRLEIEFRDGRVDVVPAGPARPEGAPDAHPPTRARETGPLPPSSAQAAADGDAVPDSAPPSPARARRSRRSKPAPDQGKLF